MRLLFVNSASSGGAVRPSAASGRLVLAHALSMHRVCAFFVLHNAYQGPPCDGLNHRAFANVKRATVSKVRLVSSRGAVANGRRPNPSVEGTCNGGPGSYPSGKAVPPSHAPHVKR